MVFLIVLYILLTVFSVILVIYNYTTKMCEGNSRVYAHGGFIFRLVMSFIPAANLYMFLAAILEPFGEFFPWHDAKTGELCRRARLEDWMNSHGKFSKE